MGKILPILFNTEAVQAILSDRKTCTRRVIKDTVKENQEINKNGKGEFELYDITPRCGIPKGKIYKPPYQPGDILYVRETWKKNLSRYMYRANYSDTEKFYQNGKEVRMKWHPSIHMPKEIARIWLKVTSVRVERLQEITEDEAKAEGANFKNGKNVGFEEKMNRTAIERFEEIWNSTIKKSDLDRYGWDANPYVWVIEFEQCEKPMESEEK